ncbi:MAG TPA: hypothetical protein PLZ84_04360, partial [Clostridia bacterium]|nr:hypothetical protein [Clostridia bacterium]
MSWILKTDDTELCIHAGPSPVITALTGKAGRNWAASPTEVALPKRLTVGKKQVPLKWVYEGAEFDESPNATRLVLTYKAEGYDVVLRSIWTSHPGPGAIEHGMTIKNDIKDSSITIYNPDSLNCELSAGEGRVEVFYVAKNRNVPRIRGTQCHVGTYLDELVPRYHAD